MFKKIVGKGCKEFLTIVLPKSDPERLLKGDIVLLRHAKKGRKEEWAWAGGPMDIFESEIFFLETNLLFGTFSQTSLDSLFRNSDGLDLSRICIVANTVCKAHSISSNTLLAFIL